MRWKHGRVTLRHSYTGTFVLPCRQRRHETYLHSSESVVKGAAGLLADVPTRAGSGRRVGSCACWLCGSLRGDLSTRSRRGTLLCEHSGVLWPVGLRRP